MEALRKMHPAHPTACALKGVFTPAWNDMLDTWGKGWPASEPGTTALRSGYGISHV